VIPPLNEAPTERDSPFPVKELFHGTWENVWSPSVEPPLGWKAYIQWGASWFSKGVYNHAVTA